MYYIVSNELAHHGIKGQKWGVRRYQNDDGSLTPAGAKRYGVDKLDSSKNKDKISSMGEKKLIKKARREQARLYRRIEGRKMMDEEDAASEKNKRTEDYQRKKEEAMERGYKLQQDRAAAKEEAKKWEIWNDDDDDWTLSDSERAAKAERKAKMDARAKEVAAKRHEAKIQAEADKDARFERENEKQYQQELKKIEKGQEAAKKQVDKYLAEKYGLSKSKVSDLQNTSKIAKAKNAVKNNPKIKKLMEQAASFDSGDSDWDSSKWNWNDSDWDD